MSKAKSKKSKEKAKPEAVKASLSMGQQRPSSYTDNDGHGNSHTAGPEMIMITDPGQVKSAPFINKENSIDFAYAGLVEKIMKKGELVHDRTGVGTYSLFGEQLVMNPIPFYKEKPVHVLFGKSIHLPSVIHELIWFLRGDTNLDYLKKNKVRIWDEWANEDGSLGPIYGEQWRRMPVPKEYQSAHKGNTFDQIYEIANNLIVNPMSRRHVLVGYNPTAVPLQGLPACHALVQFSVRQKTNTLDVAVYQRSADIFLGVPFNIASYSILQNLMCYHCGINPGKLIFNFGDVHLYRNHVDAAMRYLRQLEEHMANYRSVPTATMTLTHTSANSFLTPVFKPWDEKSFGLSIGAEYIQINNYSPMPAISAPVAV